MINLTPDQRHLFTAELQKRDPRCLRILEADAGVGTYELRSTTTGATATNTFTYCAAHGCVHTPNFDPATRDRLAVDSAKPPNPYEKGLAALRASEAPATPAQTFEQKYKAQRRVALAAEYARAKERA